MNKTLQEIKDEVGQETREIQPTLELTIDEIAENFNVSPEQIKIKK